MKKLILIALLGTIVGNAWGAASAPSARIPASIAGRSANMATATGDVKNFLLNPSQTLDSESYLYLLNGLIAALYAHQVNVAGVYATILRAFGADRKIDSIQIVRETTNELEHFGVPNDLVMNIVHAHVKALDI